MLHTDGGAKLTPTSIKMKGENWTTKQRCVILLVMVSRPRGIDCITLTRKRSFIAEIISFCEGGSGIGDSQEVLRGKYLELEFSDEE